MTRKSEMRSAEFKSGLFIIIALALLIFSVLWLRYFSVTPAMTIIAKFQDPGPVTKGMSVYYQGVNIGQVSKVAFSSDFRSTLLYLNIYNKEIKLPANVSAMMKTEGITGQKYVSMTYPNNPINYMLADGDVIKGNTPFGIEDMRDFFERQVKSGRLDSIIDNTEKTLAYAYQTSIKVDKMSTVVAGLITTNKDEFNNVLKKSSSAATDFSSTMRDISNFVGEKGVKTDLRNTLSSASQAADNISTATQSLCAITCDPKVQEDLKSAIGGAGRLMSKAEGTLDGIQTGINFSPETKGAFSGFGDLMTNLNNFVTTTNQNTNEFFKQAEQTCLVPNASYALFQAGQTLNKAGFTFDKATNTLNTIETPDGNLSSMIIRTLQSTNRAAYRIDCFTENLSDMLSKRFLLVRLMFGRPGETLNECKNPNGCPVAEEHPCPAIRQPITLNQQACPIPKSSNEQ